MSGAIFLEGERCKLKTFDDQHFEHYLKEFTGKEVLTKMLMSRPRNQKKMKERLEEKWLTDDDNIVLTVTKGSEVAGFLFLRHENNIEAEIGVLIRERFRGEGLGTESVSLLVKYALNGLRYHRVLARVLETNEASKNMLKGIGFEEEGREKEKYFTNSEYKDVIRMIVLEGDFEVSR